MIEELEGTIAETLDRLAAEPLDPRDETRFCDFLAPDGRREGWTLQGRLLASGYRFHFAHRGDYDGVRHIVDAIRANRATPAYVAARSGLLPHLEAWLGIGGRNAWIRSACDPPFTERSFALCRTAEDVARMVDRNNWGVGNAFVLADTDVCMIQQCDGPGEFLMFRGPVAFDSWTTGEPWIHGPTLVRYLDAVVRAPLDARGHPQWYELAEPAPHDGDTPVVVAESAADLRRLLG